MKIQSILAGFGVFLLCSASSNLRAEAPAYKADKSFGQTEIKRTPVCVSFDAQDRLFVLIDDGTVLNYDTEGKLLARFKAEMQPAPTTMTVAEGKVYLFNTRTTEQTVEVRGKKVKRVVPGGIGCTVFDATGKKEADLSLPEAAEASDAHFIGKELAVADLEKSQIVFYEIAGNEGKVIRKITKVFRLCCGIFDFCPARDSDSIIVANLGAFKVQLFKAGQKTTEFGQRGEKPEEFHGCCNPVNVATLPDGAIITVEKSPTRVKIYDKEGKTCTKVTGLAELVQGCSVIPIAVDSKGMIYLASDEKHCIVKCVPGVSDKPEPSEPVEEAGAVGPEMSPEFIALTENLAPLKKAKNYAKAQEEVNAFLKENPTTPDDLKILLLVDVGVAPHLESGNTEAANKVLDDVLGAYPNSELAKHRDEIKAQIKEEIEALKKSKEEEGAAQKENKEDSPKPEKK